MKKILKIFGIVIIILLLIAVLTPLLFKGKIIEKVKQEANKSLNAKIGFEGFKVSLFRNFPDLSIGIRNFTIVGIDEFKDDTLAVIPSLSITINLKSVLKGDTYEVKKVSAEQPDLLLKVLKNGKANWDIVKPSESSPTPTAEVTEAPSSFRIALRKFAVTKGKIIYNDEETRTLAEITGLDILLSGDLTADVTKLDANVNIGDLTVGYDGITYLHHAKADFKTVIDADLVNYKYTFTLTEVTINDVILGIEGYVAMPGDNIAMDLTFNSRKTDFRSLLSLVPAIYAKDFQDVQTSGLLTLNGDVKGIYNETLFPSFHLMISVENGMFKYPDLPVAVTNIRLLSKITSPGSTLDSMIVEIPQMHAEVAQNPVDIRLMLKNLMSDPWIDASMKGTVNLGQIKDFYPLPAEQKLDGLITADFSLKGSMSSLESGAYDQFTALGFIIVDNLNFSDPAFPEGIQISKARIDISPEFIQLSAFDSKFGKNDFSATGKLTNYLPYFLKDGTISGQLVTKSQYINLDDLLFGYDQGSVQAGSADTTSSLAVIEIPSDIDFILTSGFDRLIYDKIDMSNVRGIIKILDSKVTLQELKMNALGGEMIINGSYDTHLPHHPEVDLTLNIKTLDIQQAYNTFAAVETFAPLAQKTKGLFSTSLKMKTELDSAMMPVYKSLTGGGNLLTSNIVIEDIQAMNQIANILKIDKFRNMTLDKINLSYEFIDGKVVVKPFTFKLGNIGAQIGGYTSYQGAIDYILHLQIPKSEFGNSLNAVMGNLLSNVNKLGTDITLGDIVNVDVLIGGTVTQPTVKAGLKETIGTLVDDLKKQAEEELLKKKEELENQAREEAAKYMVQAQAEADKIMQEAQKKADGIVSAAQQTADKMKKDSEVNAANLIEEGKKKGPLGEIAARKAADEMKKETARKADRLVEEAKKQASGIMAEAQKNADRILQDARNKTK
ncbi:MAG: AsmA family protein [Bacteroidetes bacterium]|nr:AsmA family protein [Bacteroidota bacterium]